MKIIPVTEARSENFPSILGAVSPGIPAVEQSTVEHNLTPLFNFTFLKYEASESVLSLGPDHEHVRDGGVGDPVLAAAEQPAAPRQPPGPGLDVCGVRSVVRPRQPETSNLRTMQ